MAPHRRARRPRPSAAGRAAPISAARDRHGDGARCRRARCRAKRTERSATRHRALRTRPRAATRRRAATATTTAINSRRRRCAIRSTTWVSALALLQCALHAEFSGLFGQAQRNLIEQYLQREIWNYWIYETAWGHLNLTNFDPANARQHHADGLAGPAREGLYMIRRRRSSLRRSGLVDVPAERADGVPARHTSLARSSRELRAREILPVSVPAELDIPDLQSLRHDVARRARHVFGTKYETRSQHWLTRLDSEFTDAKGSIIGLRPNSPVGYRRFHRAVSVTRSSHMHSRQSARGVCGRSPARTRAAREQRRWRRRARIPGEGFDFGN